MLATHRLLLLLLLPLLLPLLLQVKLKLVPLELLQCRFPLRARERQEAVEGSSSSGRARSASGLEPFRFADNVLRWLIGSH